METAAFIGAAAAATAVLSTSLRASHHSAATASTSAPAPKRVAAVGGPSTTAAGHSSVVSPVRALPPAAPPASPAVLNTISCAHVASPTVNLLRVPRLADALADVPTFESPLVTRTWPRNQNFVTPCDYVIPSQKVRASASAVDAACDITSPSEALECMPGTKPLDAYVAAGPSATIVHNPATLRVAIATCGGLCPGLNTVIREVVMCLTYVYNVPRGNVFGIPNGYRGFYEGEWTPLLPDEVSHAHLRGGTILGSSRGGMDAPRIVDSLVKNGVNIVILIGGDGTHRGADLLHRTILARNLPITVACVPKTIDNDIGIIDRSFGFQTAVDEAVPAIQCAHTEALSAKNGIGLVKLMGREAGFIALYASLASRDVNMCLLPEAPWRMSNLLTWLEGRLERSAHAVIVVAEGAESLEQREAASGGTPFTPVSATPAAGGVAPTPAAGAPVARRTDESGNRILDDVGEHLKNAINAHFKSIGKVATLKYIDPSYIIRSSPANAADSELCARLAFNCVHGAMAGFTGFTVGTVDGVSVYLPTSVVANGKPQRVDILSRLYARLCSSTGQPSLE